MADIRVSRQNRLLRLAAIPVVAALAVLADAATGGWASVDWAPVLVVFGALMAIAVVRIPIRPDRRTSDRRTSEEDRR